MEDTDGSLEDSAESFVARWRGRAATAEAFARPEGVPLIECDVAGAVIQVFERTGPYLARPGPVRLIVNPSVEEVTLAPDDATCALESRGLSQVAATGRVVEVDGRTVVVDVGVPLVVSARGPLPPGLEPGHVVTFESDAPVHGFVLPPERTAHARREGVDDSI